ncbi:MAG TPA: ABC transporter permease [Fimbriimonadaceae bacterium]|nr:ABC transporter permease [Fimbriimonadaceae bacterium]HRJ33215.1 ABC transporter permease [Fimbriimonadaceae bacterium]
MRVIFSIAGTTIGEAVRRRILLIILFIGVLFLAIAPGLGALTARQETSILRGMTLSIILLTSAVIAIVLTMYMIPNEIERRTIYTILCKPVQRWQFYLGKYLGAVGALGLMMALMTAVLIFVFAIMQKGSAGDIPQLAQVPAMYFVQMSILAAVAMFFSTFTSPLVNFFLSGGVYLLGSVMNPFFETLSNDKDAHVVTKGFAWFANTVLPNFANYQVANPIINPTQQIDTQFGYYITTIGYGLVYIVALCVAGILIFDRREV